MSIREIVFDSLDNAFDNDPDFIRNSDIFEIVDDLLEYDAGIQELINTSVNGDANNFIRASLQVSVQQWKDSRKV